MRVVIRVIYNEKTSSFKKQLERTIQESSYSETEIFKVYMNIFPPIFTEFFSKRNPN